jgi:hypothetical protein
MPAPERTQVFISYSHVDAEWLTRFQIMLRPLTRNHAITVWDDTQIRAGSQWREVASDQDTAYLHLPKRSRGTAGM